MQKALAANKARSGDVATLCEKEIAETKVWVDAGHVSFFVSNEEVWGKEGPMGRGVRGMQVRRIGVSTHRRIGGGRRWADRRQCDTRGTAERLEKRSFSLSPPSLPRTSCVEAAVFEVAPYFCAK